MEEVAHPDFWRWCDTMLVGAVLEVASATYELVTVVTDVILNYEYINRNWVEEYIMSIVFLVFNGVVMGFVGLGIESLYANRYSNNTMFNKLVAFCIGLLQMRVFIETIYTVMAKLQRDKPEGDDGDDRTRVVGGHTAVDGERQQSEEKYKVLSKGLMYATFIQVIVRDIPLFVLQANATIHYRKWKFIDLFTVATTFLTLTRGAASYVAKEDGASLKFLAFIFMVGQFVFRLGAILLMAMTKNYAIVAYGVVITIFAILWTAELRLAHPSLRFMDQLPRATIFFPFFTLFVVDASTITARYGSTLTALNSKKLWKLHLWRCLESIAGIALAMCLPRYTDFGASKDSTVVIVGAICAGVYILSLVAFYCGLQYCSQEKTNHNTSSPAALEAPIYQAPQYF